jgi:hypothetical protein
MTGSQTLRPKAWNFRTPKASQGVPAGGKLSYSSFSIPDWNRKADGLESRSDSTTLRTLSRLSLMLCQVVPRVRPLLLEVTVDSTYVLASIQHRQRVEVAYITRSTLNSLPRSSRRSSDSLPVTKSSTSSSVKPPSFPPPLYPP